MGASKGEKRVAMWVGIAIGVAVSSMLVRYALDKKDKRLANRPGNYSSLMTAKDAKPFHPVPMEAMERFPNAIVVHYEENATEGPGELPAAKRSWVIETMGSFRSERLFALVAELQEDGSGISTESPKLRFSRASEAWVELTNGTKPEELEATLDRDRFRVIGENSKTSEIVVQFRDVSPTGIRNAIRELGAFQDIVQRARIVPIGPSP